MLVRIVQFICFSCFGILAFGETGSSGISATLVPDEVKPGDVFELRVEMDRAEYAKFSLDIPAQQHMHRIAVETVPVTFTEGRYRQSEKWLLQADASGSYVIKGGKVLLETGGDTLSVPLPELELVVIPYENADENPDPAELPEEIIDRSSRVSYWFWVGSLLVSISIFVMLMRRHSNKSVAGDTVENSLLFLIADELEQSKEPPIVLEKLIHDKEVGISEDLRERLIRYIYSGSGDPKLLAEELRKEAAQ
ncbi:MAG: hypothetical protein AB3N63_09825 [Puniceicoccaceae bacterium]